MFVSFLYLSVFYIKTYFRSTVLIKKNKNKWLFLSILLNHLNDLFVPSITFCTKKAFVIWQNLFKNKA